MTRARYPYPPAYRRYPSPRRRESIWNRITGNPTVQGVAGILAMGLVVGGVAWGVDTTPTKVTWEISGTCPADTLLEQTGVAYASLNDASVSLACVDTNGNTSAPVGATISAANAVPPLDCNSRDDAYVWAIYPRANFGTPPPSVVGARVVSGNVVVDLSGVGIDVGVTPGCP